MDLRAPDLDRHCHVVCPLANHHHNGVEMKCCPACGQTLPENIRLGVRLAPTLKRVFDIIHRAGNNGITGTDIRGQLYGDRADGGPESLNIISIYVSKINKLIEQARYKIISSMGPGATYVLKDISK